MPCAQSTELDPMLGEDGPGRDKFGSGLELCSSLHRSCTHDKIMVTAIIVITIIADLIMPVRVAARNVILLIYHKGASGETPKTRWTLLYIMVKYSMF